MLKKAALIGVGALLVGGLLFGGRLIPYAKTAISKVRDSAQHSVPLSFQIDAAREQLKKIRPEINDMVYQIAKERAAIKRLEREVTNQKDMLTRQQSEIMTLRAHLKTGDEVYVATTGKAYSNARVEEDLRHRFSIFQTAKQTAEKSEQILELRRKSLDSAMAKLEGAQASERELEVQIENLTARERMVDVAKTASSINFSGSQISRTQKMIEEINCQIDAEEEMLELAPKYLGEIPVGKTSEVSGNIAEEIDAYFSTPSEGDLTVVKK